VNCLSRCTCADASDYVRSLLYVMCHIACWFRSGAVLKFDQFYHSSFFEPSLDLFPRKCMYAKVIDLPNMVMWSIGLQIDVASPPHQISLCPLLVTTVTFSFETSPDKTLREKCGGTWHIIRAGARWLGVLPEPGLGAPNIQYNAFNTWYLRKQKHRFILTNAYNSIFYSINTTYKADKRTHLLCFNLGK